MVQVVPHCTCWRWGESWRGKHVWFVHSEPAHTGCSEELQLLTSDFTLHQSLSATAAAPADLPRTQFRSHESQSSQGRKLFENQKILRPQQHTDHRAPCFHFELKQQPALANSSEVTQNAPPRPLEVRKRSRTKSSKEQRISCQTQEVLGPRRRSHWGGQGTSALLLTES